MKIIASLCVGLGLISAPCSAETINMSGPFMGLHAGYGIGTAPVSGIFQNNPPPVPLHDTSNLSVKGFLGGVHFGYDHVFGQFFLLGVEGAINLNSHKGTSSHLRDMGTRTVDKLAATRQHSFSMAIRVGGIVKGSTALYGKLGLERTRWKIAHVSNDTLVFDVRASDIKQNYINGIILGLGAQTMLDKNWYVGGEWSYTIYQDLPELRITGTPNLFLTAKIKRPTVHDLKIRVGYKF